MNKFEYSDIVTKQDKVLFLGPGIPNNLGGMYNYVLLWLDAIKSFTNTYQLLAKPAFFSHLNPHIWEQNILSDKNQRTIKIFAIMGIICPIQITALFFKKDFKESLSKYTIVHILTASFLTNTLIKVLFYFDKNIKIIYTLHDPKSHDEKISWAGKQIKEYNLKAIYEFSLKNKRFYLHLHSEKLLKDCPEQIGNVIIHPHPLPKKLIKEKPIKTHSKVRFGFLGRIEPYKGLDVMFEAFYSIQNEMSELIEIVIVGRGDFDADKWKTELRYDMNIVNEIVSDEFFHQQMNSLDCLILPYKKASQSGVGYLALAYNIPIIATNTGGLPDIISKSNQKKSILIPANDSKTLAEAIKKITV